MDFYSQLFRQCVIFCLCISPQLPLGSTFPINKNCQQLIILTSKVQFIITENFAEIAGNRKFNFWQNPCPALQSMVTQTLLMLSVSLNLHIVIPLIFLSP